MMFLPSRDGFLTQLQETGCAIVTVTASDDIAIVVDAVRAHVDILALPGIRVWQRRNVGSFLVTVREEAPDGN